MKANSLISITTCNRLSEVKKYIWDYLRFINQNSNFHFVLALDGNETSYIEFAEEYDIPLIYSEEREGVGLSKNRVLTQFPDYEYYFFIEDDVELLNSEIFNKIIQISKRKNYPHFCNNHEKSKIYEEYFDHIKITHSMTGGAQFAFYSKVGIDKVGGFNTCFAKYKRYGHTEHTYRFMHAKLQPNPFIFPPSFFNYFIVHAPKVVTQICNVKTNKLQLIDEEQRLIDLKINFINLKTLCEFHYNNKPLGYNETVDLFLQKHPYKYPLTKRKKRRIAFAEHYALRLTKSGSTFQKIILFLKSIWYYPTNVALKHYIKTDLFGKR
jgi:hypothetical protein